MRLVSCLFCSPKAQVLAIPISQIEIRDYYNEAEYIYCNSPKALIISQTIRRPDTPRTNSNRYIAPKANYDLIYTFSLWGHSVLSDHNLDGLHEGGGRRRRGTKGKKVKLETIWEQTWKLNLADLIRTAEMLQGSRIQQNTHRNLNTE